MIIAVSDLHLGDSLSNEKGFMDFIQEYLKPNQKEITNLVLLGDILDFWGKNITVVMRDHSHIFDVLTSLDFETHYLVGNHDFAIIDKRLSFREDVDIGTNLFLKNGKTTFRFIHGHQLNYWYALSFYELFSHAMCYVTEEDETSDVWAILQNNLERFPKALADRAKLVSLEKRRAIERKLAGPLIGQEYRIDDSFIRELNLLRDFVELKTPQKKNFRTLQSEIESLGTEISNLSNGEISGEIVHDILPSEIPRSYLTFQEHFYSWARSKNEILGGHLGRMQRIAAILSINLPYNEFLIHGHGHKMMIDYENRVADAGCWIGDSGSFVSISDGEVSCARWPKR